MAVDKEAVQAANAKALDQIAKAVKKVAPDATIKSVSDARGIFNYGLGVLTCRNCGYPNPPAFDVLEQPVCLGCGLNQEITIYLGPLVPPVIEEPKVEEPSQAVDVELVENGKLPEAG